MNAQELRDAGVVNVKLVYNAGTGLPPGTTQEVFYGINHVSDEMLADLTFDSIDDFNMATYTSA